MKHPEITYTFKYDYSCVDDDVFNIDISDPEKRDIKIESSLLDMAYEYDEIQFKGYMDGHHYMITSVINLITGDELTKYEIEEMLYHAHDPECIGIRLNNDESFCEYMTGFYN